MRQKYYRLYATGNIPEACDMMEWETLVFNGPWADQMDRCSGTRADAWAMHARMVEVVSQPRDIKVD